MRMIESGPPVEVLAKRATLLVRNGIATEVGTPYQVRIAGVALGRAANDRRPRLEAPRGCPGTCPTCGEQCRPHQVGIARRDFGGFLELVECDCDQRRRFDRFVPDEVA